MASHSRDETEAVTDRTHDTSWSANLEESQYATDRSLLVRHAIEATERTAGGYHVNLVTHEAHEHPETCLYGALDGRFGDSNVRWEYVEQRPLATRTGTGTP